MDRRIESSVFGNNEKVFLEWEEYWFVLVFLCLGRWSLFFCGEGVVARVYLEFFMFCVLRL